ncbi:tam domain methyltransferase [Colletotrichum musicola]|uniref:Tam domain methyltransferase n=1 Tax=Colletotrichum musicola TaxID=2175873 RepID=A0A8H6NFT5_9PEZI|nr:tam domain methyltransferase [Colletotrichum musicola]
MSSEHPRIFSTDSERPQTPPSTRPSLSIQSKQTGDEQHPEDHPSPTSDEVNQTVWAGASDSDEISDETTTNLSVRAPSRLSVNTQKKDKKSFFQSIFNKFAKTGRRFGFVPNSKEEQDRNVLQHQIIAELFDGRLHLAPVGKARAVLDVGTGPGVWALVRNHFPSTAKNNPTCSVVGIDIEKVRPPYTMPNCQFRVMDAAGKWDLNRQFDFIHVRMLGDFADKEQLVRTVYEHLNPGGWVEFTEWIAVLQSPDRSLNGTAFHKWNLLLRQGLRNMGRSLQYPSQYQPLLCKAGFERLRLTKYAAPTNACYPGKKCQRFGAMMVDNWNAIIEPLSVPVFTIGLGWSEPQVQNLVRDVRKEIADTNYHSFMTLLTVYCRKPRSGTSSTASLASSSRSATRAPPTSSSNLSNNVASQA